MANLFLWVAPLLGLRRVRVTERRTGADFAEQLRLLAEEDFPEAERIVLVHTRVDAVTDNLNTHSVACLYDAFDPEQAGRIAERLEWHYTPEHGSWLNVAEIELSILSRQCLNRRIADRDTLAREVAAWQARREAAGAATIDWQFTAEDARVTLRRLYPIVKESRAETSSSS